MEDRFKNWQYPEIEEGKFTKYNWIVQNKEGLKLGKYTDIGALCYINAKNEVLIEEGVQIGGGCKIYSQDTIGSKEGKIILKKNSKIGANSVLLPNVTVGENSIIAAGSVVKFGTIIPANEIWAGSPARKIRDIWFYV